LLGMSCAAQTAAGNVNSFASVNPLAAAPRGPAPRLANGRIDLGPLAARRRLPDVRYLARLKKRREYFDEARRGKDQKSASLEGRSRGSLPANGRSAPRALSLAASGGAGIHLHAFRREHSQLPPDFMDGRKHPADPDPTWHGHSLGRW